MNDSVAAYSLFELVERFGGEVVGDGSVRIARVATLENAGSDAISFLANERYLHQLKSTGAAALILAPSARDAVDRPRIISSNPYLLFARVSALLNPERALEPGPHPNAVVAASASVDPSAEIGACASIGAGARVGPRTLIGPGVSIGRDVAVGADSRLHGLRPTLAGGALP